MPYIRQDTTLIDRDSPIPAYQQIVRSLTNRIIDGEWQPNDKDEARDEFFNLRIPIEKEGADFMYSVIAPEPKFRTQLIYQAAAIFNECDLNWTLPMNRG